MKVTKTNKKNGLNYKKGNMIDLLFLGIMLPAIILVIIIMYKILVPVNEMFQESDDIPNLSKEIIGENTDKYPSLFDSLIIFLYIGLTIATAISAFFVDTHPIFFFALLLLLIIIIIISVSISNFMQVTLNDDTMINESIKFGTTQHLINNYPMYMLISGIIIIIALFLRPGQQQ